MYFIDGKIMIHMGWNKCTGNNYEKPSCNWKIFFGWVIIIL
jgi:hypothetical protein